MNKIKLALKKLILSTKLMKGLRNSTFLRNTIKFLKKVIKFLKKVIKSLKNSTIIFIFVYLVKLFFAYLDRIIEVFELLKINGETPSFWTKCVYVIGIVAINFTLYVYYVCWKLVIFGFKFGFLLCQFIWIIIKKWMIFKQKYLFKSFVIKIYGHNILVGFDWWIWGLDEKTGKMVPLKADKNVVLTLWKYCFYFNLILFFFFLWIKHKIKSK